MQYYLAVDIGASSGRHILGSVQNGKIVLEEVYRFENRLERKDGHLCWNMEKLFSEIVAGLQKCKEIGKIPVTMGIDTWGVDFVLLDGNDNVIGDAVSYRDSRTTGMDDLVAAQIPDQELFQRTGIQRQIFNTIYQLYALKQEHPEYLQQAKSFLMIPQYFNFLLTGKKYNEYTLATTTGMVNAQSKTWDEFIIEKLGYPKHLFGKLYPPKTSVGYFTQAIKQKVGFDCEVILPATHDTGSAVLAVPTQNDDTVYISSGTWSLMGIEKETPVLSEAAQQLNFTNEGGYEYRYRFLKNIMGLWIIQSVRHNLNDQYTFDELCAQAIAADGFTSEIDVYDNAFLAPDNMIDAIRDYCKKTGQAVPQTVGEISRCVYVSLAKGYAQTIKQIETVTGREYSTINIVGGGSKDSYLNALTAKYTQKTVYAGPVEATALGNILVQMIKAGEYSSLKQARAAIAESFVIKKIDETK